jgi:hypothetical protein
MDNDSYPGSSFTLQLLPRFESTPPPSPGHDMLASDKQPTTIWPATDVRSVLADRSDKGIWLCFSGPSPASPHPWPAFQLEMRNVVRGGAVYTWSVFSEQVVIPRVAHLH